jgi:UDP-2,3-diacylglucosamine pyrophosphatase LpxH
VLLMRCNGVVNFFRSLLGLGHWSLSAYVKAEVKNVVNFISSFEKTLADEARRRGADGVVCGHIHHAAIRDMQGVTYMNCGDWVESCTALVEDHDGSFRIISWRQERLSTGHDTKVTTIGSRSADQAAA